MELRDFFERSVALQRAKLSHITLMVMVVVMVVVVVVVGLQVCGGGTVFREALAKEFLVVALELL